jgi:hypothetical protein
MVKKFLILGFIMFILLAMTGFAQEVTDNIDIAPEDQVMPELAAVEPLPEDTAMQAAGDFQPPEPTLYEEDFGIGFTPEEEEQMFAEEPAPVVPAAVVGPAVGFIVLYLVLMLVIVAILIAAFVFWIWMLIDCVKRDFKHENDKVVWILVLVFVGLIGAIIYYFVIRRPAKKHR